MGIRPAVYTIRLANSTFDGYIPGSSMLESRSHAVRRQSGGFSAGRGTNMISRRSLLSASLAGFVAVLLPGSTVAENFPTRPIRLIVPYAAGGGTDAIARVIADGAGAQLGQSFVVENNGTAGGNIATQQAAAAAPDGYTVLMANQGPMVVNPHLFKSLRVDPLAVFDPVTLITSAPLVLVVPQESRFTSFKQLVDYGLADPGKLTYGSAGNGSASHMATILLAKVAKLNFVHVPYRGAGPALTDLLGGRTDFMITTLPSVSGLIETGRMRPLALTTKTRTKKLPDVPTIAESGFADYDSGAWYGFVVPKGTPPEVVEKLRAATVRAINSEAVKTRLENDGAEPIGNTPAEFAAMMRAESARWAEVIKESALSLE
jgi:tripartite-type tricarboxylate transporter receptor subunit TctC